MEAQRGKIVRLFHIAIIAMPQVPNRKIKRSDNDGVLAPVPDLSMELRHLENGNERWGG